MLQGIGLAVAEAMAEAGAHVALWYNSNSAAVDRAADFAKKHGIVSLPQWVCSRP